MWNFSLTRAGCCLWNNISTLISLSCSQSTLAIISGELLDSSSPWLLIPGVFVILVSVSGRTLISDWYSQMSTSNTCNHLWRRKVRLIPDWVSGSSGCSPDVLQLTLAPSQKLFNWWTLPLTSGSPVCSEASAAAQASPEPRLLVSSPQRVRRV